MKKKIVVLHIVNKMDRAGAEMLIMNIMRKIDPDKFQFKFLVKTNIEGQFDDEIRKLGGEIFNIQRYNGLNYFPYKKSLKKFYSEHKEIDIVHAHQGSSAYLDTKYAKKVGIKTIAHSHNTYLKGKISLKELLFKIASFKTRFICDYYIGCSEDALLSRYGKNIRKRKKCFVLNNGIDIKKYAFSLDKRLQIRKQFGIDNDSTVYAFVGRLTDIKNPFFAIKLFNEILAKSENSYLFIAGVGPLSDAVNERLKKEGKNRIFAVGNVPNVDAFMSASDFLLMPSLKEGFPVTLVEAQCNGIYCLVSDRITADVKLTDKIKFLPIDKEDDYNVWLNNCLSCQHNIENREKIPDSISVNFSDTNTISNLTNIYCELAKK